MRDQASNFEPAQVLLSAVCRRKATLSSRQESAKSLTQAGTFGRRVALGGLHLPFVRANGENVDLAQGVNSLRGPPSEDEDLVVVVDRDFVSVSASSVVKISRRKCHLCHVSTALRR